DGQSLAYSTYLGGSIRDVAKAVAVDESDQAYVTGSTVSTDFPTVAAFQDHLGSAGGYTDAFVTKRAADGRALVYSTYLGGGGDEIGLGIAVDKTGAAYVTGATEGGLPLQDPVQHDPGGQFDAFLTKLVPDGDALEYSTFFGAGGDDVGFGIAVD